MSSQGCVLEGCSGPGVLVTRYALLHHPTPTAYPSKILAALHSNLSPTIQVCISRDRGIESIK